MVTTEAQDRRRRMSRLGLLLILLVVGVLLLYSLPIPAPDLPDSIPAELAPRFAEAHAYIWPEILAGWVRPAIGMLLLYLIVLSGAAVAIETRYGADKLRRWPLRILFLLVFYAMISLIDTPNSIRSFYHARAFGLTQLTLAESLELSLRATPFAFAVFVLKFLLVFCCLAIFRARWWVAAAVLVLVVFELAPERLSRTVPLDPILTLEPLPDGPYREAMDRVSALAEEDIDYLVEDRSQRSDTVNMYMTGRVGREYVVVTDTLLGCLSPDEVAVVLAHEYGHKLSRPVTVPLSMILTVAKMLAVFYLVHWFHHRRAIPERDRLQALVYIMLAAMAVSLLDYPFSCALYRYQERTSDAYALELTGDATALRSALLKVGAANLEPWEVPGWVYLTSASHPQLRDRVRMAETFTPR